MEEVKIEININSPDDKHVLLEVFPFDFSKLSDLLKEIAGEIIITKIHAVLFNEGTDENEDIYITDENYLDVIGKVNSINEIIDFFVSQKLDYTINKLEFTRGKIRVFYDDDALLHITLPKGDDLEQVDFYRRILNLFI